MPKKQERRGSTYRHIIYMNSKGKLILFCGKMGAGKTTLSKSISAEPKSILISEDEWLSSHYAEQINSFEDYLSYSQKIKPFIKEHIQSILTAGITVVLDFPANTLNQRQWLLSLSNEIGSEHELVYVNVTDEVCLAQISNRRKDQPERAQFDTPEVFRQVTSHFQAPSESEGLNIVERKNA